MNGNDWSIAGQSELLKLSLPGGGWSYRGTTWSSEPTALACLALLAACESDHARKETLPIIHAGADRLAAIQTREGSIGLSAAHPSPGWITPYALLLWKALGVYEDHCRRAAAWILTQKGRTLSRDDDPNHIAGHDTTLVGWPWVANTHSWLEPTAMAVLALDRAGLGAHPRVFEGLKLIRDREIESGGWNYGNKAVFGRPLRPQPAPTGLALLTLSGIDPETAPIKSAIHYLQSMLPSVRACSSLSWAILGLRAWNEQPADANLWLSQAFDAVTGRPDAAPRLACLLLAGSEPTLSLFGRETLALASAH